jgi:hydroxyacylglutathione hydrolase
MTVKNHIEKGDTISMSHDKPSAVIPIRLGVITSFIVKGSKAVIVDTGYPGNANNIISHIRENSIKPEDVSLIVLTHGHIDHYGSAEELKKITGAPIAAHKADAEFLKRGINYIGTPARLSGRLLKFFYGGTDSVQTKPLEVDIELDDELDLREFGIVGRVIHTPGHTEGSLSLILSTGEAIVGDLVMGGILFKKKPGYPLFVSNMSQLRESIERVLQLSPTIICASHGGPFSPAMLQKLFHEELKTNTLQ